MKIYTKQGDAGQTGLYGGARVPKDHLRIQTYGTLDELNASLGVALALPAIPELTSDRLTRIQSELFQLGAELATPAGKATGIELITEQHVARLETEIDQMEGELPPLKNFILPGGSAESAALHLSRTISRRAERELVALHRQEPVREVVLQYLNRMSDYLFVSARYCNLKRGVSDVDWKPPR
jgi:cob(I)alamin adenosyltransferase